MSKLQFDSKSGDIDKSCDITTYQLGLSRAKIGDMKRFFDITIYLKELFVRYRKKLSYH